MSTNRSRRWFISAGVAIAAVGGAQLASRAGGTLTITVPAMQMAKRASDFRRSLISDYLASQTPYPIYSVLFRSGLLPDDIQAEQRLGRCGNIVFANNIATLSAPPSSDLVLPYHILLSDQQLRNEITIPKQLQISITRAAGDQAITFGFSPAIGVKQIDRYTVNGIVAPIPADLKLNALFISDASMRYEFTAANGIAYMIVLDFTAASGPPQLSLRRRSSGGSWLALLLAGCISLTGCVNNMGGGINGSGNPPPAYPDKEVCYDQPAPTGYVRINSKIGGLNGCVASSGVPNIYVYTDYIDQPSKTQLEVCADAPIPPGYYDVSGAYHDDKGCDSDEHAGTTYANARLIYKT